jgi:hypothetical protein
MDDKWVASMEVQSAVLLVAWMAGWMVASMAASMVL